MENTTTQKMYKQNKNSLERIEALENMLPNLIQALGRQLDSQKAKTESVAELVDTLIGIVGTEKVEEALMANRLATAIDKAEKQKAHTAELLANGTLVPAETVEANSVLVLSSKNAETGEPVGAGWFRFHMSELKPEIRETMMGKSRGFTDSDGAQTFQILEIYNIVNTATPAAPTPVAVEVN